MRKTFINDDYLLGTKTACELYHGYAEQMPILDYHCHLPPAEIAADRRWDDIADVWLGGDHYKWRQMRTCGFGERFCSGRGKDGSASGWEKFLAYAKTMERLVKNPLFDWSHLELARYFGVNERLCGASAKRIYAACNRRLKERWFSAQGLMRKSNVRVICTTDDPDDDLRFHDKIAKTLRDVQVRPTWRPDRILKEALKNSRDPMPHLAERHDYFAKHGCVLSDYGLDEIPEGRMADWLVACMKLDAKAGWVSQLHFNCIRNPNSRAFKTLGPDTGFDVVGESGGGARLAKIFDRLEREGLLPKTVVYSLNPSDMPALGALIGAFQDGSSVGKLQLGAAWWFNDHRRGMEEHLEVLSALGALGSFIGMLTDSRSFLSFTRHEYFRRILCQKLGEGVEKGEIPNDVKWLGQIVRDISFNNANRYFCFGV